MFKNMGHPPMGVARGGVKAEEVAIGTEDIKFVAIDRRRRPGARVGRLLIGIAYFANALQPDLSAAVARIEGLDELVIEVFAAEDIKSVADDSRSRVAAAEVAQLPEKLWAFGGPNFEQSGFSGDAIAVRSAPLGLVGGVCAVKDGCQGSHQCDHDCNRKL